MPNESVWLLSNATNAVLIIMPNVQQEQMNYYGQPEQVNYYEQLEQVNPYDKQTN